MIDQESLFKSILLVEDEPAHALLIKRSLKEYCSQISHSESVADALKPNPQKEFDLIITDLNLPDSKGVKHVQLLKDSYQEVPIIVLTSSTLLHDAVEAMKLGARDFIVKNFDVDLKDALGLALSRVYSSTALEREKRRLEREMSALRTAIENGNDALAVTDGSGSVVYSNSSFANFAKLCGGNPASIHTLLGDQVKDYQQLQEKIKSHVSSLSPGGAWHTEINLKQGKDLAYGLSLSVIGRASTENSTSNECVIWAKDISPLKSRERFQREILSTTTHDLKGPLGAIMISSELLTDLVTGHDKVKELVARIGSAAQGAINLIDEFLSARRIQEGTFVLKPTQQEIKGILNGVATDYKAIADAKGILINLSITPDTLTAQVDKLGLTRVIGNLLGNALKFTPKGGSVKIEAQEVGDGITISVSDSGCGMEPSDIQRIFSRFSRLEKHREIPGTGLGLFVVKAIVTAHGGKIDVTSKLGEGTRFEISLPQKPPTNEAGELICLDFA